MTATEAFYAKHHGPKKPFRQGLWRCARDDASMEHSLAIWQHLELFSKPEERVTRCTVKDIVFDCQEHGAEVA